MNSAKLQTIVKGFANHYRIETLWLLKRRPRLDVDEIASALRANYKTVSVHIRQLSSTGLIFKRYKGSRVEHTLTKRGESVLKFLGKLE